MKYYFILLVLPFLVLAKCSDHAESLKEDIKSIVKSYPVIDFSDMPNDYNSMASWALEHVNEEGGLIR